MPAEITVPTLRTFTVVLLVSLFFGQQPAAQGLTFALFESYVNALRQQAGIPGLALAIVRDGRLVDDWLKGYGVASVSGAVPVLPDTPFAIADLSQTIAATLLLRHCIDRGEAELDDQVHRWSPGFPEAATTFAQLLRIPAPVATVSTVIDMPGSRRRSRSAATSPTPRLVYDDIMTGLAMTSPVPGGDVRTNGSFVRLIFPIPTIREFNCALDRMAVPYRVDSSRRPAPSEYRVPRLDASNGFVGSVRDIANFEAALDGTFLLSRTTRELAWQRRFGGPMGYGWFVQQVNSRKVVWHFGLEPNAFSSLVIKVPDRRPHPDSSRQQRRPDRPVQAPARERRRDGLAVCEDFLLATWLIAGSVPHSRRATWCARPRLRRRTGISPRFSGGILRETRRWPICSISAPTARRSRSADRRRSPSASSGSKPTTPSSRNSSRTPTPSRPDPAAAGARQPRADPDRQRDAARPAGMDAGVAAAVPGRGRWVDGCLSQLRGRQRNSFPVNCNLTAVNVGGGAIGMLGNRAGLRFDFRRFRGIGPTSSSCFAVSSPRVNFWRAIVGVTLRY